MFTNKKIMAMLGTVFIAVILVFIGLQVQKATHLTQTSNSDLPVISENTGPTETAEQVVTEPFVADEPEDGIDVSDIKDTDTPEEVEARDKALEEYPIAQDDADAIKAAADEANRTEDAIKNPQPKEDPVKGEDEGIKVVAPKTEPTPAPAPKKDADGYIISKEQAIKDGADALQNAINTNYFVWTDTYESLKNDGYTDEDINALINKVKNDPYASTVLSKGYDFYRIDGDKLGLADFILLWISNGGRDNAYSGSGV